MNELATQSNDSTLQVRPEEQFSASGLILNEGAMDRLYKFAETMAAGVATVPKHLQGNVADCFAVCTQAHLWRMNPYAVGQKTHISQSGALGYEAQLVNAVITTLAPIKNRPDYEFLGDWSKILGKVEERKSDKGGKYYVAVWKPGDEAGLGVIVRCTLIGEDAPREVTVMLTQAYPRFSTQWATDPQQQICYLAVRKWARRFTPDVLLGVYTPEELSVQPPKNMGAAEVVESTSLAGLGADVLAAWRGAADKGTESARKHWGAMTADQRRIATEDQKKEMWSLAVEADKTRTVDTPAAAERQAAQTVEQAADPKTGEVDADFVAAMDKAEAKGDAK